MPINRKQAPCRLAGLAGTHLVGKLGALTITVMLFYLGSLPFAVELILEPWDKLAHFIVFSIITTLLWLGTAGRQPLLIIAMVTLIGTLDEWHQGYLPGRNMDIADLATDVGAAIFMLIVLHVFCRNLEST